ncbi:MAG TPA: hypothetical protein VEF76_05035 [Patescibacteria group bacterium]|nr:hypothetical protein [Patescibacteria group bacterium]
MPDKFVKDNDYTLSVIQNVAGGTLTRQFNFAAEQVTTLYERKAEMSHSLGEYSTGKATAVSVALATQMAIQKFSDLDSTAEVDLLRAKLVEMGGKIPSASGGKPKLTAPGG